MAKIVYSIQQTDGGYAVSFAEHLFSNTGAADLQELARSYSSDSRFDEASMWFAFPDYATAERFAEHAVLQDHLNSINKSLDSGDRDLGIVYGHLSAVMEAVLKCREDNGFAEDLFKLFNGDRKVLGGGTLQEYLTGRFRQLNDGLHPEFRDEWNVLEELSGGHLRELCWCLAYGLPEEKARLLMPALYPVADNTLKAQLEEKKSSLKAAAAELNIGYMPFGLRRDITVTLPDDLDEPQEKTFRFAAVEGDDIVLYERMLDTYGGSNGLVSGTFLYELPEAARMEVLDSMLDQLGDDTNNLVLVEDRGQVPDYALGPIVNNDFSGIDDEEDERNIRDYVARYPGCDFAYDNDTLGFVPSPEFGKGADCVTMFVYRPTTVGEQRERVRAEQEQAATESRGSEQSVSSVENSVVVDDRYWESRLSEFLQEKFGADFELNFSIPLYFDDADGSRQQANGLILSDSGDRSGLFVEVGRDGFRPVHEFGHFEELLKHATAQLILDTLQDANEEPAKTVLFNNMEGNALAGVIDCATVTTEGELVICKLRMENGDVAEDYLSGQELIDGLGTVTLEQILDQTEYAVHHGLVRSGIEQQSVAPVQEQQERPYTISFGTFPGLSDVEGDIHVDFAANINAVGFRELKEMAEQMGGSARTTYGHTWADFYREADAELFARKVVDLNAERIAESRRKTNAVIDNMAPIYVVPEKDGRPQLFAVHGHFRDSGNEDYDTTNSYFVEQYLHDHSGDTLADRGYDVSSDGVFMFLDQKAALDFADLHRNYCEAMGFGAARDEAVHASKRERFYENAFTYDMSQQAYIQKRLSEGTYMTEDSLSFNDEKSWLSYAMKQQELVDGAAVNGIEHENNPLRYHFVGPKGAMNLDVNLGDNNISFLRHATTLDTLGRTEASIKLDTGWEKGADGKWRLEIPAFRTVDPYGNVQWMKEHPDVARWKELNSKLTAAELELGEPLTDEEQRELERLSALDDVRSYGYSKTMKQGTLTLQDYIDAPELFAAYPDLRGVEVRTEHFDDDRYQGYYSTREELDIDAPDGEPFTVLREIVISDELMAACGSFNYDRLKELRGAFVHEIQHYIQDVEGFADGTNLMEGTDMKYKVLLDIDESVDGRLWEGRGQQPIVSAADVRQQLARRPDNRLPLSYYYSDNLDAVAVKYGFEDFSKLLEGFDDLPTPEKSYLYSAGEVEARNAARRMNMSRMERLHSLAVSTEDVSRELQIVSYGSGVSAAVDFTPLSDREVFADFIANTSPESRLNLLRMASMDMEYYLKNGPLHGYSDRHLTFGSFDRQVEGMKALYEAIPEGSRPDWMSLEKIDGYRLRYEQRPPLKDGVYTVDIPLRREDLSFHMEPWFRELKTDRPSVLSIEVSDGRIVSYRGWYGEGEAAGLIGINDLSDEGSLLLYDAVRQENVREMAALNTVMERMRSAGIPVFADRGLAFSRQFMDDNGRRMLDSGGRMYGFVRKDGTIFVDPDIATAETPLHEFAHLWGLVMQRCRPEEWKGIIKMLRDTPQWQQVRRDYPHLQTSDEIAEEVLAHYSGERGHRRLMESFGLKDGKGVESLPEEQKSFFVRISEAIARFWAGVSDFLHIHYTSKEQVADRIFDDAMKGINPVDYAGVSVGKLLAGMSRSHFIGEQGARNYARNVSPSFLPDLLKFAKDAEKDGMDAGRIKMISGWEKGADDKWRYEIGNVRVKSMHILEGTKLSDVLDATDLFRAYPDMKDIRVRFGKISQDATYNPETRTVTLNERYRPTEVPREELQNVYDRNESKIRDLQARMDAGQGEPGLLANMDRMLSNRESLSGRIEASRSISEIWPDISEVFDHEVQHAIQHEEGFAVGGSLRTVADMRRRDSQVIIDKYQDIYDEFKVLEFRAFNTSDSEIAMDSYNELKQYEADHGAEISAYQSAVQERYDAEMDVVSGMLSERNFDEYRRLAGEVEARNVAARRHLSVLERRATLAVSTEDVPRNRQILTTGMSEAASMTEAPAEYKVLREAKERLRGVLDQARAELGDSYAVQSVYLSVRGTKLTIDAVEHDSGSGILDTYALTGVGDNGESYRLPVDKLQNVDSVYILYFKVREAQLLDKVRTLGRLDFAGTGIPVPVGDRDARDFVTSVSIDDKGKLDIAGHRLFSDGDKAAIDHGTGLHLDAYDKLYDIVSRIQQVNERPDLSATIGASLNWSYDQESTATVKESLLRSLENYRETFGVEDVDLRAFVEDREITDRHQLMTAAADAAALIHEAALKSDKLKLYHFLPQPLTRREESEQFVNDVVAAAEGLRNFRVNDKGKEVEHAVGNVNALLEKYNRLSEQADPYFALSSHPVHYHVVSKYDNEMRLVSGDGKGGSQMMTSWTDFAGILAKLRSLESSMKEKFPQLGVEENRMTVGEELMLRSYKVALEGGLSVGESLDFPSNTKFVLQGYAFGDTEAKGIVHDEAKGLCIRAAGMRIPLLDLNGFDRRDALTAFESALLVKALDRNVSVKFQEPVLTDSQISAAALIKAAREKGVSPDYQHEGRAFVSAVANDGGILNLDCHRVLADGTKEQFQSYSYGDVDIDKVFDHAVKEGLFNDRQQAMKVSPAVGETEESSVQLSVDERLDLYETLKRSRPDEMVILIHDGKAETFGDDAQTLSGAVGVDFVERYSDDTESRFIMLDVPMKDVERVADNFGFNVRIVDASDRTLAAAVRQELAMETGSRQSLVGSVTERLESLLPDTGDKLVLSTPFTVLQLEGAAYPRATDVKEIQKVILPETGNAVFSCGDDLSTFRVDDMKVADLEKLDAVLRQDEYEYVSAKEYENVLSSSVEEAESKVTVSVDGDTVSVSAGEGESENYTRLHGWTHEDPALIYSFTKVDVFFYDEEKNTVENIDNDAGIDVYEVRKGFFLVRTDEYEEAYRQLEEHDHAEMYAEATSRLKDILPEPGDRLVLSKNIEFRNPDALKDDGMEKIFAVRRESSDAFMAEVADGSINIDSLHSDILASLDDCLSKKQYETASSLTLEADALTFPFRPDDIVVSKDKSGNMMTCRITGVEPDLVHYVVSNGFMMVGQSLRPSSDTDLWSMADADTKAAFVKEEQRLGADTSRKGLSVKVEEALGRLLPENGDKLVLKSRFTVRAAEGLKEDRNVLVADVRRAYSVDLDRDVFLCGSDRGGVNTLRLYNEDLMNLLMRVEHQEYVLVPSEPQKVADSLGQDVGREDAQAEQPAEEHRELRAEVAELNAALQEIRSIVGEVMPIMPVRVDLGEGPETVSFIRAVKDDFLNDHSGHSILYGISDPKEISTLIEAVRASVRDQQEADREAEQQKREAEKARRREEQQKREERQKNQRKYGPDDRVAIQAALLVAALASSKEHGGDWLNRDCRNAPFFVPGTHLVASPFNEVMMTLHASANGYHTAGYATFDSAKQGGFDVLQGERSTLYLQADREERFENSMTGDRLDRAAYDALPDEKKQLYCAVFTRQPQAVFNIDQTGMADERPDDYEHYCDHAVNEGAVVKAASEDEIVDRMKKKFPDALVAVLVGDSYRFSGQDAVVAGSVFSMDIRDDVPGERASWSFHKDVLESYLPKLVDSDKKICIVDGWFDHEKSTAIVNAAYDRVEKTARGLMAAKLSVNYSNAVSSGYNEALGVLNISRSRQNPYGESVSTAVDRVSAAYRAVASRLLQPDCLNISGRTGALPSDRAHYLALVQEVVAGAELARMGLPARLDDDNARHRVSYWTRELQSSSQLVQQLENDVNSVVTIIDAITEGRQVDWSLTRQTGRSVDNSKQYSISEFLASQADLAAGHIVVVSDPVRKEASVIVPDEGDGRTLDRDGILLPLRAMGIEHVSFFTPGGVRGLAETNDWYAGKEVTLQRYQAVPADGAVEHTLKPLQWFELEEEIVRSRTAQITYVDLIPGDARRALLIKADDGNVVTIYPEPEDERLVESVRGTRQEPASQSALEAIGRKYYNLVMEHPDMEQNLLTPKGVEIDMSHFSRVSLARDENAVGKFLLYADIDGKQQQPVSIDAFQAERFWLVADRDMHKMLMLSELFRDKLGLAPQHPDESVLRGGEGRSAAPSRIPEPEMQKEEKTQQEVRHRPFRLS